MLADNAKHVASYSALAQQHRITVTVYVEVNVGHGRCGVDGEDRAAVVSLCQQIRDSPGLVFGGLHCYQGRLQHVRSYQDRKQSVEEVAALSRACKEAVQAAGIQCPVRIGFFLKFVCVCVCVGSLFV